MLTLHVPIRKVHTLVPASRASLATDESAKKSTSAATDPTSVVIVQHVLTTLVVTTVPVRLVSTEQTREDARPRMSALTILVQPDQNVSIFSVLSHAFVQRDSVVSQSPVAVTLMNVRRAWPVVPSMQRASMRSVGSSACATRATRETARPVATPTNVSVATTVPGMPSAKTPRAASPVPVTQATSETVLRAS